MKKSNLKIEELELDYTEAIELFSDETLDTMQMAKVKGGKLKPTGNVILDLVAIGLAIYSIITGCTDDGGTEEDVKAKTSSVTITDENGKKYEATGDSIHVTTSDGTEITVVTKRNN